MTWNEREILGIEIGKAVTAILAGAFLVGGAVLAHRYGAAAVIQPLIGMVLAMILSEVREIRRRLDQDE